MMSSIVTAIALALGQPQQMVAKAVDQFTEAIAAQQQSIEEMVQKLDALSREIQDSVASPYPDRDNRNPFKEIEEWHTAMAKLHSVHKRATYWKRTRAQILEPVSDMELPDINIVIVVAIFI